MTVVEDHAVSDVTVARSRARSGPGLGGLRPLLLRLHFYVGVLVAPFLFVSAVTGLLFAFAPQLDRFVYRHELVVPVHGAREPLSVQVADARLVHPEGVVAGVVPPVAPRDTTQVVLSGVPGLGQDTRTVYVDPYTGAVRGALTTTRFGDRPVTAWLEELHRSLHLGAVGRVYSETSASWLWVLAAVGLLLWLRRRRSVRRLRRVLLPDRAATGRRRTLSWHGAVGAWLAVGMLAISATGLTWSQFAGARFDALLTAWHAHAPTVSAILPAGSRGRAAPVDVSDVDTVLAGGHRSGIAGPVEVVLPSAAGQAWVVQETGRTWPLHRDSVAVDPGDGRVVAVDRYADWPVLAKFSQLGINAHMGYLFGPLNQVALAVFAVGVIAMLVLGYRSWWQRRPRCGSMFRMGRPVPRGAWRRGHPAVLVALAVAVVAVGVALPVFGVELAGFLVIDAAAGAALRYRARRLSAA